MAREFPTPFTFWTDFRHEEPPFVEVTEGGSFHRPQLFDKLELVIFKRGFNSLRFSSMMKEIGLTKFLVGTPRPKINVSTILHHSAFDLAGWDRMLLPFNAPI